MSYRGYFRDGRAPSEGCRVEASARAGFDFGCCEAADPISPVGWCCTRRRGHQGDHVVRVRDGRVIARWGLHGARNDPEPETEVAP